MSRADNQSLKVRGLPKVVLGRLDRMVQKSGTTRNRVALDAIGAYAQGILTPRASPGPFDPTRKGTPYGENTAPLAINGIAKDVFASFMERAKRDGWHSKNDLIIELLRDFVAKQR